MLSEQQTQELNKAILQYLYTQPNKFADTIATFKLEAAIEEPCKAGHSLEKNWISSMHLQEKVIELEQKLQALRSELPGVGTKAIGMPRGPVKATFSGHRRAVTCICVHPLLGIVASGSEDKCIKLWNYETGAVTALSFNHVGTVLASAASDMTCKIWDAQNVEYVCTRTLSGHKYSLTGVSFLNEFLFTSSMDKSVKMWDLFNGHLMADRFLHSEGVRCLTCATYHIDGQPLSLMVTGGMDNLVILSNALSGEVMQILRGHEHVVETVSTNCTNQSQLNAQKSKRFLVVSGSRDRTIKIWEPLMSTDCLYSFHGHDSWVRGVCLQQVYSSNIDELKWYAISVSDDKSIKVFSFKENRCIKTILNAHANFITALVLSPDGKTLLTCSTDKNICSWNCD